MQISTPRETIAGNARAEIARRRVRQSDLVDVLGVSQPALSRRLNGEVDFTIGELQALAAYLEISLEQLLHSIPAEAATA